MVLACRALNQAIGRCIRHKHDYGGIILLDRRFGDVRNRKDLSCWWSLTSPPPRDIQTLHCETCALHCSRTGSQVV